MIPSFIIQPQSYLPPHISQLWSQHSCHSLSISCTGHALRLPTLLSSYHPHTFPSSASSSSSPSDDWKQKCLHIFHGTDMKNKKKKQPQQHGKDKGEEKKPPLIVFNIASKPSTYYGMLVASALKFNYKLITLGWLVQPEHDLPREYYFGYKVISVYEILTQCYHHDVIQNDTVIMVVDGTDVILQRHSSYILNEFDQSDASILFGGEMPKSMRTDFTDLKYEERIRQSLTKTHSSVGVAGTTRTGTTRAGATTRTGATATGGGTYDPKMLTMWNLRPKDMIFLYLNSGCFIGKVGELLKWYQYWANPPYLEVEKGPSGLQVKKIQPLRQFSSSTELWNRRKELNKVTKTPRAYFVEDQFNAIHMYLDQVIPQVQVDTKAKIFLSTYLGGVKALPTFLLKNNRTQITFSIQTQTIPAVLHFAGPSKYLSCMSQYVKTFYSTSEVNELFSTSLQSNDHHQHSQQQDQEQGKEGVEGREEWRDHLVMLDSNLDLVPSSLITTALLKSWIPRYPMRCHE